MAQLNLTKYISNELHFPAMYITLNAGCITHVLHMY